jgi:hypothetical protein
VRKRWMAELAQVWSQRKGYLWKIRSQVLIHLVVWMQFTD